MARKVSREPIGQHSLNIFENLRYRERPGKGSIMRNNYIIMKKLVCDKKASFTKIWGKSSKKTITYESNRLYFDNYRTCYSTVGFQERPHLLYKLPSCSPQEKIEDALFCECPVEQIPMKKVNDHRAHLLTLTKNNWMIRYDLDSGEVLQQVFLSDSHKFRHLSWDTVGYKVAVKSILSRSLIRQNDPSIPTLVIAVFEIFPFKLCACVELTKQVFKKSISDAVVEQGMLIMMHPGNLIRIFSFDRLVKENTTVITQLGQPHPNMEGFVGHYPAGIPTTVQLKDFPPVLFELRCDEHSLWIGGDPWHYMYQPTKDSVRMICAFDTRDVIRNGEVKISSSNSEMDNLYFMLDDSNRVVHVGLNNAKIMKINSDENGLTQLDPLFTIYPHDNGDHPISNINEGHFVSEGGDNEESPFQTWLITSSGRIVRRRVNLDEIGLSCNRIYSLDFENQLDLLVSTSVAADQFCPSVDAYVRFHDNDTGDVLKIVDLEEGWDDTYSHSLMADLDTLVHVYTDSDKHRCVIYRLNRALESTESSGSIDKSDSGD